MGTHDRDQFDDLLDSALKRYGNVEPRAGLEGRVLANLPGIEQGPHWWTSWAWGLAAVSTVVLIASLWVTWSAHNSTHQRLAARVTPELSAPGITAKPDASQVKTSSRPALRHRHGHTVAAVRHGEPRLNHFPSEREPNSEELLLVKYVERFPEEAKLIAQEQQRFEDETRKLEQELERKQER